jgi:glycosyltransferase involved in cell wall biosynthesis
VRILFLNPVGTLGGAERSLLELLAILSEERPDWKVVLLTGDEGPLVRAAKNLGVDARVLPLPVSIKSLGDSGISGVGGPWRLWLMGLSLPWRIMDFWAYIWKLRRRINKFRPDVIHSNGFKFHVTLGLLGKVKAKTIWHARDFLSPRKIVGKVLRNGCRMPDLVVANSRSVARDWDTCIKGVAKTVLYNSVSIPNLGIQLEPSRTPFGPNLGGVLRVGLVGSYAKWKGHLVFLEAVRILAPLFPSSKVQFFVVGGPLYATGGSQWTRAELENLADSMGVSDRVEFLPHQTELDPIYRSLDLVVQASTKPEPFGRTIVEGMAYGKAVVAALDGGVCEIIDDGKDALAFRPGDPEDMARKIARVLLDHELRVRLGMAGREKAQDHFSRVALKAKVVGMYEELVGAGP